MDPATLAKIVQALGIFEAVGKTISFLIDLANNRRMADQSQPVDKKLDEVLTKLLESGITINLVLDEPLMNLLRTRAETPERPQADWIQSTRGLIRGRETEFQALTELQVSSQAIGTEALTNQPTWDTHDGMLDTVAAYLALPAPLVDTNLLPDSTLNRALAKVASEGPHQPTVDDLQNAFGVINTPPWDDQRS